MTIEQRYARGLWLLLLPGLCLTPITSLARADASASVGVGVAAALQRLAAFKTAVVQVELADLGSAVDLLLRDQLDGLHDLSMVSQPALDLPSLQLALDCAGETAACLALVAERTQADLLLGPTLTRTDNAILLSLMLYDQGRDVPLQVVTRRFPLSAGDDAVLNGVTELLQELFGISPQKPAPALSPSSVQPAPPAVTVPPSAAKPSAPEPGPSLLLPIALGAAGVAFIGAGIGFGLAAESAESDYAAYKVATTRDAKRALELYHHAETHATLSNIGFGVGAAAVAAGALVFILQQRSAPAHDEPAAKAPHLEVGLGQLSVAGAWD